MQYRTGDIRMGTAMLQHPQPDFLSVLIQQAETYKIIQILVTESFITL